MDEGELKEIIKDLNSKNNNFKLKAIKSLVEAAKNGKNINRCLNIKENRVFYKKNIKKYYFKLFYRD